MDASGFIEVPCLIFRFPLLDNRLSPFFLPRKGFSVPTIAFNLDSAVANNDNKIDIKKVRSRILEIISSMSEIEMRKLLKGLEKWQQASRISKREHPRKDTSIYAFLEADDLSFNDFIKNVSSGGLYIETEAPLSVNKELFIRFLHPETGTLTRITGKIVRVDSKGLGVQFDDPRSDL